jgi:hypothetical protein
MTEDDERASLERPTANPPWPAGTLLRELDQAAVYYTLPQAAPWWFGGGSLLWIPSPDALTALGLSPQDVNVVPAGSLDRFAKCSLLTDPVTFHPLTAPAQTLSSFLFPPKLGIWWAPPHAKWFPRLEVPGLTLPNGAHVAEIRGWLRMVFPTVNDPCGQADWHLWLEPDPLWMKRIGADLSTFIKVGDIFNRPDDGSLPPVVSSPDSTSFAAVPGFELEYCGWPTNNWKYTLTTPRPADWVLPIFFQGCTTIWPFLPTHDSIEPATALVPGDYVRVIGSIVTDEPHNGGPNQWQEGYGEHDELNPARWTEIHPPDIIQKIPDPGYAVGLYSVAVIASAGLFDFGGKDQSCTATFPAPPNPQSNVPLTVQEIVGPETVLSTITEGNATLTGAQIAIDANSVTVHVAVHGDWNGQQGQFKAIYLVKWGPLILPKLAVDVSYLVPTLLSD